MSTRSMIRNSEYHDSVRLMETARELTRLPGVLDAAAVMATPANLSILREAGLLLPEIESATANDLVVVVRAEDDDAAEQAIAHVQAQLARRPQTSATGTVFQPRTIRGAVHSHAGANLAIISVAGRYAVAEAWEALHSGLHVLLFSDNVPIEQEVALKRYAIAHDLLMMGPDCGTAILNGVALGFANAVPRGPVGIVAAAGTGLQEASTLLARLGVGISHGIGVGGRDLKPQVGGMMMMHGIAALQADPQTRILLLVSKPPAPEVARRVLAQARQGARPTVVCFLGGDPAPVIEAGLIPARTLQQAAYLAARLAGAIDMEADEVIERERAELLARAGEWKGRLRPGQVYLRGLFSGGTLAAEALVIWQESLEGLTSNVSGARPLANATRSVGHCAVDLGEDEFTVGRPHPMIDNDLRIRRLLQEAADPEVAVVVLDVVLGYGAHPDPAGELAPAIGQARALAAAAGRELIVVASVTGTEADPQRLSRQVQALEGAGAIVASCNAAATRLAGFIVA
ncbi:MAG: acyl-CoA synthetase FdrA [Anaerolineae bacterium]|nr:acyl-CoA synthetase FdrA [Anaerolineae bacterium]